VESPQSQSCYGEFQEERARTKVPRRAIADLGRVEAELPDGRRVARDEIGFWFDLPLQQPRPASAAFGFRRIVLVRIPGVIS
jgi:hypothetical protein